MNILYLFGSERSLQYSMRAWMEDNRAVMSRSDRKRRVAETHSGLRVFFHTYNEPDRLHGMEFGAVFRDDSPVEATQAQQAATEEHVMIRVRAVKTPPAIT